ncbi:MAG: formylglycine-generating enzyme family protein [Prolixibacteraceae bacterium]|nr:formylglycine-generating enzyme family protein [Prolixibacteraceae bacterium]
MPEMKKISCALLVFLVFSCSGTKNKPGQMASGSVENTAIKKESVPSSLENVEAEMILVPAGTYIVGSNTGIPNDAPAHEVTLKPYYLDKTPVTVAQFRKFVYATGYKTEAENYGDAGVFNFDMQQWQLVKGANWEYPFGPSAPKAEDNHPVTQVSWTDAVHYASWAGKRLPTEAEWEVAAKSAKKPGSRFSWGDQLLVGGKYKANVWQGEIAGSKADDGYLYTSPVGAFGTNEAGFADMGGNVWNWCADVFCPYEGSAMPFQVNENVKVIRGGSFFFDQYGEDSFTTTGRFFNSMETSLFNTGFRCAKDAD